MTNYADEQYNKLIETIQSTGEWDKGENVRTVYESDKAPAYTKSIFGHQVKFPDNSIPLITSKKVFALTAAKELWLFWIMQTVQEKDFKENNVKIWDNWFNEQGNLGRSYAYQFESHRHHQRELVTIDPVIKEQTFDNYIAEPFNESIGSVKNYTEKEIKTLRELYYQMFDTAAENDNIFVDKRWGSFEQFLRDIRYIPQFFLAKEKGFKNWVLSPLYFHSNHYSPESCAWITVNEHYLYEEMYNEDQSIKSRYELSRNQVVDLINGLRNNSQSRRHMTSFWNQADVDKKQLQECAWSTQWNVKGEMSDLLLIQRSVDTGLGLPFNWFQYWLLHQIVAQVCGLTPRSFTHQMGNVHYYDRHEESLLEQIKKPTFATPIIKINSEVVDFFDFTPKDMYIEFYDSGDHVPLEVAE